MRILAIIFNVLLLGESVLLICDGGLHGIGWLIVMTFVLTPIFNLIALLFTKGDNWMSLYFKRKAMEEKKKIEQLSDNNN